MSTTRETRLDAPSAPASASSDSVKVTWFDRDAVMQEVRQAAAEMVCRRPEIQRVLLFGSLAVGTPVPGSDADLLIILKHSDLRFPDRIPDYIPSGCSVGVDVFPYTETEIESMLAASNFFIRRALQEGIEIYCRET